MSFSHNTITVLPGRNEKKATMMDRPSALTATDAPPRTKPSNYPEPFAARMSGRTKRPLGDLFGLKNFGVDLTRLAPGAVSTMHHRHSRQDEFIYVIEGQPTLFVDHNKIELCPDMVAGFSAGGPAHHLENRTDRDCVILEVGDHSEVDEANYPADDIQAVLGSDWKWRFAHKTGEAY